MAKKAALSSSSAAAAALAPIAKPASTRSRSARHKAPAAEKPVLASTAAPVETPTEIPAAVEEVAIENVPLVPSEDATEVIRNIAYGYWEARGYEGGNEIEDWVRAEQEYYGRRS